MTFDEKDTKHYLKIISSGPIKFSGPVRFVDGFEVDLSDLPLERDPDPSNRGFRLVRGKGEEVHLYVSQDLYDRTGCGGGEITTYPSSAAYRDYLEGRGTLEDFRKAPLMITKKLEK